MKKYKLTKEIPEYLKKNIFKQYKENNNKI